MPYLSAHELSSRLPISGIPEQETQSHGALDQKWFTPWPNHYDDVVDDDDDNHEAVLVVISDH